MKTLELRRPISYDKEIKISKTLHKGYQVFFDKDHPMNGEFGGGKILYHRHVASIKEGRWLKSSEHVHHIDFDKLNNDPSNLLVCSDAEHKKIHNDALYAISNEQLKKLLWEMPINRLSKVLGISAGSIAKRADKLGIQRPEPNYWTKSKLKFSKCPQCKKLFRLKSKDQVCCCADCAKKYSGKNKRRFFTTKVELKKLVWEKPIAQIAKEFNVSESMVFRRCKSWNIKTPPKGYWNRAKPKFSTCPVCGNLFIKNRDSQKHCSVDCKYIGHRGWLKKKLESNSKDV